MAIITGWIEMQLSEEDIEQFYDLFHNLLIYINKKLNIITNINSPEKLEELPLEEINKIRVELYKKPKLIETYINETQQKRR